jgi:hypothetical protein
MALRTTTADNTFDVTPAAGDRLFIKHHLTALAGDYGTSPAMDATGTGTVGTSGSSTTLTGSGTAFTTQLGPGYLLKIGSGPTIAVVRSVESATSLTLDYAVSVAGGSGFTFTPLALYLSGSAVSVNLSGGLVYRGPWAVNYTGGSRADVITVAAGAGAECHAPAGVHYPVVLKLATGQLTRLALNGTAGARAYWRSNAAGGNTYFERFGTSTGGFLYARYADVTRIGTATLTAYDIEPVAGQPSFDVEQTIFDGCGLITADNRLSNGSATTTVRVVDCTWLNSLTKPCVALPPGLAGCAFTWSGAINDTDVRGQWSYWTVGGPGDDDWCLAEGPSGIDTNGVTFAPGTNLFQHVFKRKTENNEDFACTGDTQDCYFLCDNAPGHSNLHPCPVDSRFPHDVLRCVWENAGFNSVSGLPDEESDMTQAPGNTDLAGPWTVRHGIKLPHAGADASAGTLTASCIGVARLAFEHCTFHLGSAVADGTSGIRIGESAFDYAGQMAAIKGNLFWDTSIRDVGYSCLVGAYDSFQLVEDACYPADFGPNAWHNARTGTHNRVGGVEGQSILGVDYIKWSALPSATGLVADPQFVWQVQGLDPATDFGCLGLAGWARSLGATGTPRQRLDYALAQLRLKNHPTGYDARYSLPALLAYVRGLHRPTNPAYAGLTSDIDSSGLTDAAGNDMGGTPGAMAYQAVAPPLDMTNFDSFLTWSRTTTGKVYPDDYVQSDFLGNLVDTIADPNGADHYDSVRVYQNIRDYTGDPSWETEIQIAFNRWIEGGSVSFGCFRPYDAESLGVARYYRETGAPLGRAATCQMRTFESYISGRPTLAIGSYWTASRETAFGILHCLNSEDLGYPPLATIHDHAANARGHLIQHSPEGVFGDPTFPFFLYIRPFFVGLICEALIAYWDRYRDHPSCPPDIPATIKRALDWIWDNDWYPEWHSFGYTDHDTDLPGYHAPWGPFTITSVTSNGVFATDAAELASYDNYYWSAGLVFTTGALAGNGYSIESYVGATKTFGLLSVDGGQWLPAVPPAVGDQFTLSVAGGDPFGSLFESSHLSLMTSPAYAWYFWYTAVILGTPDDTYRDRHDQVFNGSSIVHPDGTGLGSHKEYNQNYRWTFEGLRWRAWAHDPPPDATALSWAAPDGLTGRANAWGLRVLVSLAGGNVTLPGPVTLTPSDGGAGGTFRPETHPITPDRPYACFQYRPAPGATGSIPLSLANDGGLTDPAPLTFTVVGTAPTATGYTFSPPTSGPVGGESAPFPLALSPPGSALPSSFDGGGGYLYVTPNGDRPGPGGVGTEAGDAVNFYRLNGWPVIGAYHVPLDDAISHSLTYYVPADRAGIHRLNTGNDNGWPDPAPYTAPLNYTAPPPVTGRRLRIALAGGRRLRLRLGG